MAWRAEVCGFRVGTNGPVVLNRIDIDNRTGISPESVEILEEMAETCTGLTIEGQRLRLTPRGEGMEDRHLQFISDIMDATCDMWCKYADKDPEDEDFDGKEFDAAVPYIMLDEYLTRRERQ